MSIKSITKKILAIVTAGVMTMGIAMPNVAFADEGTKVSKAYISKTYNTEVAKAETFNFTATQVKTGEGVITVDHSITMPAISFTTETGSTTKVGEITFGTFTQAGKYVYTVKEGTADPTVTNGDHEKLIMSQAEYTMSVYVVEDGGTLKIDNIIVDKVKDDQGGTVTGKVDIGSEPTTNGFRFENTYVQEAGTGTTPSTPDPEYNNFGSLNVTKKIVLANRETVDTAKDFDFTATFTFPAGTDANTLGGVKVNGNPATLTGGTTYTFKLKHNEKSTFTGLPVGTKITVTEAATPNYKGSAQVTINGADAGTVTASKYDEAITVSEKSLGQKKNAVDVTNSYNNVPIAGIIMNILPYVLMLALCGGAIAAYFAFKRKGCER